MISGPAQVTGTAGQAFNYNVQAANNPAGFSATGLPAWAYINTSTGAITGTPYAPGSSNVTVSATNAAGTGTATLAIVIEKTPSLVDRMKGDVDGQGAQMTFMEHLLELRRRLVLCAFTIVLCMALAMAFYEPLFRLMRWPVDNLNHLYAAKYVAEKLKNPDTARVLARKYVEEVLGKPDPAKAEAEQQWEEILKNPDTRKDLAERHVNEVLRIPEIGQVHIELISTDPMDTLLLVMWLAIGAGLVLSSPVLIYQLWSFVAPGLREKERHAIKPVLYGGIFFFLSGCALAYFLLFPVSIRFFSALNIDLKVTSKWTMEKYSSLLLNMLAICGLVCETPLVVAALAKLGLLKPAHLTRYWRLCILGSFILGAAFSPGTDVMSMMLFSGLLLSLYGLSILMAHVFYPKGKE